jgi:hypothetical protein
MDMVTNLRSGERLIIRGGKVDDLKMGHEIFVREVYRPPGAMQTFRVSGGTRMIGSGLVFFATTGTATTAAWEGNSRLNRKS